MSQRTYIGARYVPLIMGEWDSSVSYEPLSIVFDNDKSYTSRQYVPIGIPITDDTYWAQTGSIVPTDSQIEAAVSTWLEEHPEVTTTVQDNSITNAKLVQTGGILSTVSDNYNEMWDNDLLLAKIDEFREKHNDGITPIDSNDVLSKRATGTLSTSNAGTKTLSISNVTTGKWGFTCIPGMNELNYRPQGMPTILIGISDNYFYGITHSIHNSCTLRKFNENGLVDSTSLPFSATSSDYAMARIVYEAGKFTIYAVKSCVAEDKPIEVNSFAITDYFSDAKCITPTFGLVNDSNKTLTIYDQYEVWAKFIDWKTGALEKATDYNSNMFNIQPLTNSDLSILSNKTITPAIDASGNITASVTNPENHWFIIEFARRNIRVNAEYIVIGMGTSMISGNPQQDVVLALCCKAGNNCGKLVVFRYGFLDFEFDASSIGTITKTNYPNFIVKSRYVVSVQLDNGNFVDLDIRNCKNKLASYQISWNYTTLGIVENETGFSAASVSQHVINPFENQWDKKQWFAFGDSITYMGYYIEPCASILNCINTKFGHGGQGYTDLASEYTEMIGTGTTPDIITLFAGTNDFGHSETIADMQSGMRTILNGLYAAFPNVTIVVITPLQRNFDASQTPGETSGLGPNSLGKYLIDYVDAIIEVANEYSAPVLDFYKDGGINVLNADAKTSDGLHPTSTYGTILGKELAKFISKLYPFN